MSELSETPFRVYRLEGPSNNPTCVVSTDEFSLGEALLDLHRDGRAGGQALGILYRPVDGEPGEWLVNPWNTGRDGTRLIMENEAAVASGRLDRATEDDDGGIMRQEIDDLNRHAREDEIRDEVRREYE